MRKAPVLTAAAAALFLLFLPAPSEARSRHRRIASRRALPHAHRSAEAARAAKAASVIHQTERSGEVVLDAIEVVTAENSVESGTPVPEAQDYPQPPCPPEDPVIEAHVHVVDADAPEKPETEILERRESPRISRIARRLSSLFRPKSATARVRPRDVDLSELLAENFLIPVEGVDRQRLKDSFLESRGQYARHLAIDIGAPRGTPILATADGEIVKLTREGRGGITIYQKDATGRYLFFYCHLSRYAGGLRVGGPVEKGDVIGYVRATGHVIGGPHLHFSITRLPEDADNLREGLAINPYLIFLAGVP